MGDFYETFNDDAEIASKVLNITLTTRDKKDDPTPLAGFPHHAINQYLPKLVKAGYKVAIADQMEDPRLAKGIVRREVTRVVTPGTLLDNSSGNDDKNNFIAAVFRLKKIFGLAYCDMATGEFEITETANIDNLRDEIGRIGPSEILISSKQDFSQFSDYSIQPLDEYKFEYERSKEILCDNFGTKSLSPFGITNYKSAVISAGAIIYYLQETQKTDLSHIRKIKYIDLKGNMILDRSTLKNLDIIYSSSEMGGKASLIGVLDNTMTSMGARKLRNWIIHPLLDKKEIVKRIENVDSLYNDLNSLGEIRDQLKSVSDIERISGKIGLNRANARDLVSLKDTLSNILSLCDFLKQAEILSDLCSKITKQKAKIKDIINLIDKSIVDNPPNTIMEGHIIKEGYDKEIDEIKTQTKESKDWIENLQSHERERTGISSLKVSSNKVFGYYIEVTNTHKEKIPEDYVRKQTLVNSERYITPELKQKEAIVLNAQEKLNELEYQSFQEVRDKLIKYLETVQDVSEAISVIDVISNLAYVANHNNYCKPEILDFGEETGILDIENGRHPIVEGISKEEFVSNDMTVDLHEHRLIILTGPNMSGKSTYIRQMALIVLMAQIGSFVPASSAKISLVDRIFTRVGASDDLSAGRSTFLVEMDEAANIINNATKYSFIVLDEIGRGTSTYDGVSIAWAVAEYINEKIGARCLFATHYHELLKLEDELPGIKNYNVAVVEEGDEVIFLRKIEEGGTNKSYGIHVAKMAGLPDELINRAEEILSGFEQEDMFGVRSNKVDSDKQRDPGEPTRHDLQDDRSESQLSFMDNDLANNMPTLYSELKNLDLDNLTPLEALKKIAKWKKRLSN
jgi:DNA mismatch repair protein MutS